MNLYRKGDCNTKAVNEFRKVEVLCPKWSGREKAGLKEIAAIAQCQGTAERWPLVTGITKGQINFWSPQKCLQPARCGEDSYVVTPASYKSQQGQIMCKNCLFSAFQKRSWVEKTLKSLWLHLIPNQNSQWAANCSLSNFEVFRRLLPTGILYLWLPSIKGTLLLPRYCSPSL